jgi:predicted Zn-dependent protease
MRKFSLFLVVIGSLLNNATAFAGPAEEIVAGTEKYIGAVVAQEEKEKRIYRDERLESIYHKLQAAFIAAGYPVDTSYPIRVDEEALTGAAGHILFIGREVLTYDDDTVAYVVGHEMVHLVMRDQETETERLLAFAAERGQVLDFVVSEQSVTDALRGTPATLANVSSQLSQSLVSTIPVAIAAPVLINQIAVSSQIVAAKSQRSQPLAFDVPAYLLLAKQSRDGQVLPKDFYQSHEVRADKVGGLMAVAAGFHPAKEKIRAILYDLGGQRESYDHPAADVRVAVMDFLR